MRHRLENNRFQERDLAQLTPRQRLIVRLQQQINDNARNARDPNFVRAAQAIPQQAPVAPQMEPMDESEEETNMDIRPSF